MTKNHDEKSTDELTSHKILLADDEPDTLMLTSFTLTRAGFNVVIAESGQQALEVYQQEKPVLVILDRMMPEMDGLEVCRQLRALDPEVYILILTALDTDNDRVAGWEAGADDYMGKPLNFKELVLRVKARMRRVRNVNNPSQPLPQQDLNETPRSMVTGLTEAETEKPDTTLSVENLEMQNLLISASRAAQSEEYETARELYAHALDKEPFNPVALKWLAYHTSDPHEGCYYLEMLVKVQPQNTKAARLLEIGRQRCQELDQQSFSSILSHLNEVPASLPGPFSNGVNSTTIKKQIGQILVEKGYITLENIETAATLQEMFRRTGAPRKLGEILVDFGVVTEEQLKRVLNEQNPTALA